MGDQKHSKQYTEEEKHHETDDFRHKQILDSDFSPTYFPRRDRSNTVYYGQKKENEKPHSVPPQNEQSHIQPRPERDTAIPHPSRIETKESHTDISAMDRRRQGLNTIHQDQEDMSRRMQIPKHRKKKKRRMKKGIKIVLCVIVVVLLGSTSAIFMKNMFSADGSEENYTGVTTAVTIPAGAGTADIADILKENGLIHSTFLFRMSSKLNGYDGTYQQGTYDIDTGMTNTQIMSLLQTIPVHDENKLTIPEGFSIQQIAERVDEMGICTKEEFMTEAQTGTFPYAFLQDIPQRELKLEGYLFPDTYFLSENMTPHELISMMLERFEDVYIDKYQEDITNSGHTLDELLTVASMIEKEITVDEERAKAAGVIYNRLKEDMSLGIDATVLYAVGKTGDTLTEEDLKVDSPYNTRVNKGLPPGPISNPGEASFRAALYPEEHQYLYYVVEAAGKENHIFCETYDDFLAAKEKYKNSLSQ